jgi:hypothetical protein
MVNQLSVVQECNPHEAGAWIDGENSLAYRTKNCEDYRFALDCRNDGYRVYVLALANGCTQRSAPHLLHDRTGAYICWSRSIPTEKAALAVAAQWAENVQRYAKTGTSF